MLLALTDAYVKAINDGAHHSDLSHAPPGPYDTPDVVAARANASAIVARWIQEASASGGERRSGGEASREWRVTR